MALKFSLMLLDISQHPVHQNQLKNKIYIDIVVDRSAV